MVTPQLGPLDEPEYQEANKAPENVHHDQLFFLI